MKYMSETERIKKAGEALRKISENVSRRKSPFDGMSKDESIELMRKVREKLWEEKIGVSSGRK